MAKDMHWFKFFISEYLAGDIMLCSDAAQGVFMRICCLYWARDGNLSHAQIKGHLPGRESYVAELVLSGVIKNTGDNDDFIRISFMDEQRETCVKTSAENSQNGKLGGRGNSRKSDRESASKAPYKAGLKPPQSQLERDKISLPANQAGKDDLVSEPNSSSNPSPPLTGGSALTALKPASSNPETIKHKRDFLGDLEPYRFLKREMDSISEAFNEIMDKDVLGFYMSFRRKYKTEDNKHKKARYNDLMDLIETYWPEDESDES